MQEELGLTAGGFLLFALLCGGDYHSGVDKCGESSALGLVHCGFGDQLLSALERLEGIKLEKFLIEWRTEVKKELCSNSKGMLSSRQPHLASTFPDSFPPLDIVALYLNPRTSWSPMGNIPDTSMWAQRVQREPCIHNITEFCSVHFGWKQDTTLKQKLNRLLWEGVFLRLLYSVRYNNQWRQKTPNYYHHMQPLVLYDPSRKLLASPESQAKIIKASRLCRKGRFASLGSQPRLLVSAENFIALMGRGIGSTDSDTFRVWVPESLLPKGLISDFALLKGKASQSQQVSEYEHEAKGKKGKARGKTANAMGTDLSQEATAERKGKARERPIDIVMGQPLHLDDDINSEDDSSIDNEVDFFRPVASDDNGGSSRVGQSPIVRSLGVLDLTEEAQSPVIQSRRVIDLTTDDDVGEMEVIDLTGGD